MGTRNSPGQFDCYANAEPDEPMFILLGRDRDGPALVRTWATKREARGEDPAKVAEARACADQMEAWAAGRELRAQLASVELDPAVVAYIKACPVCGLEDTASHAGQCPNRVCPYPADPGNRRDAELVPLSAVEDSHGRR